MACAWARRETHWAGQVGGLGRIDSKGWGNLWGLRTLESSARDPKMGWRWRRWVTAERREAGCSGGPGGGAEGCKFIKIIKIINISRVV
jgi:hypothetical protein